MSFSENTLVDKLFGELKKRKMSVPEFSIATGIPKDRVYKWKQQGTSPKAEDEKIILAWINGSHVENTPIQTPPKDLSASYIALMEERIRELKEDKEWLKSQIESNLNAIYVGVKSNQAHQVAILQYTTLRDMKGDEAKAQKAMDNVGKHAAEILNGRRDTVLKSNS